MKHAHHVWRNRITIGERIFWTLGIAVTIILLLVQECT